jgi:hypothetical protein
LRAGFTAIAVVAVWVVGTGPALAAKATGMDMNECLVLDGGQHVIVAGTEVCCAKAPRGDERPSQGTGPGYCVVCDPPGSDNCELFLLAVAPPADKLNNILIRGLLAQQETILVEQEKIRTDLGQVLAGIGELQTRIENVEAACAPAGRTAVE